MPIPKPRKGESSKEFISRCVSSLHDTDPNRPNKQIVAICFSTYRKAKGISETHIKEIVDWYETTLKKTDVKGTVPKWVTMARKLLKSKRGNPKLRAYWQKRLDKWEKKNGK